MRNIKYIVIHCSAGFGNLESVKKHWKEVLGWKTVGYHYFITEDGTVTQLADINTITNGVKGFNSQSVHISYQGGVQKTNLSKAQDTRTDAQKKSIINTIQLVLKQLRANKQDTSKVIILGHRDFSPDKNGNGVVDSWERIKECPSFDAIPEYKHLITS